MMENLEFSMMMMMMRYLTTAAAVVADETRYDDEQRWSEMESLIAGCRQHKKNNDEGIIKFKIMITSHRTLKHKIKC